jgi:indolepyruvate decarboxylase
MSSEAKTTPKTAIQHVLGRLKDLGITDVFGVPGDYAFPINDAICGDKDMGFIGSCNEINAAYSADGYARVKGLGAINPTYGPGELNAISGIAGAYAEHVPIFHLTALPSRELQRDRAFVHHTLGNGEFDLFYEMAPPSVCARTIVTPENCVAETERLIAAALYHRRPVYMAFPMDVANEPVVGSGSPLAAPQSNPASLEKAANAIVDALTRAKTACVLPGILVARAELRGEATALINASGLPFATMIMDKTTLDEAHPNYIGMYDGRLTEESVRAFVEGADCVVGLGALWSDFSSGAFTAKLDRSKTINVMHHSTRVGDAFFEDVEMKDVLTALTARLPKRTNGKGPKPSDLGVPTGTGGDKITAEALYPRWNRFLKPDDILVAETGTSSMGLGMAKMPKGATFHNQTLWGAIGWATPAAFGAAIAAPDRRTVLVTGRRLPPAHGAGGGPVSPFRAEADHLPFEQQRLSDRAPALQGPRDLLQRCRTVALPPAAAGAGLRRLVHGARHHLRGTRRRNEQGRVMWHRRVYRGGHGQVRRTAYGDEAARVHQGTLQELSECL